MRTLTLLLPLAALAQGDAPAFAPDRSLLRRPFIPSEDLCPTWVESSGFRAARGEATGALRDDVLARARENGVGILSAALCHGQEMSARCLAARAAVAPLGPGEWQRRGLSGWACASVAVEETLLTSQERELEALAADLSVLAAALGAGPLQLLAPRWAETGCPVGEVGAHLLLLVRQHLGGVALVDAGEPAGAARQVRLEVSTAGGRVLVATSTRGAGEPAWTALAAPPVSFAADLFQLRPDDARTCPDETDLGLAAGERPGAADLRAQLFMAGQDGLFCDGEAATPRVEVSGPARLRLYSLQVDGQGFQVWPHRAEDDRVYSPAAPPTLPPFTATRTFDGSDSRLVVAAFPPETALAPAAFCRLPAPLDPVSLPGAALASASWHVAAAGERLCAARGDAQAAASDRAHAEAAIRQAPICGKLP